MKELKNLEAIRELLASHPIYTYDYSDGLLINKEDTNIHNAIEKWESDHRETEIFQQLAVSELFNQLNK
jgi:hypothetical protein